MIDFRPNVKKWPGSQLFAGQYGFPVLGSTAQFCQKRGSSSRVGTSSRTSAGTSATNRPVNSTCPSLDVTSPAPTTESSAGT
jgi:hypothetical protein